MTRETGCRAPSESTREGLSAAAGGVRPRFGGHLSRRGNGPGRRDPGRYDTESARAGGAPTVSEPTEELLATSRDAPTPASRSSTARSTRWSSSSSSKTPRSCSRSARSAARCSAPAAGRSGADDDELLVAPPGLYTQPALEHDDFDRSLMLSLCVLALRLDVVRYDAWHDPLTGLFDRRSFDRLLDMAIARGNRYGWQFTLVLVDLDGLKQINDTEGHAGGRRRAARARRALPPACSRIGDDAARIGGDEFAMILPNTTPEQLEQLLERVRNARRASSDRAAPFSYGWAQIPDDATDHDELMATADRRLYEAKAGGR